MSKHTPGKWMVRHASYGRNGCVIMDVYVARDGDNMSIAADISDPDTGEFSIANARLIAAAPELLGSLEMCIRSMESLLPDFNPFDQAAYDKARAAIAKAKGERA